MKYSFNLGIGLISFRFPSRNESLVESESFAMVFDSFWSFAMVLVASQSSTSDFAVNTSQQAPNNPSKPLNHSPFDLNIARHTISIANIEAKGNWQ
jgi:hypothetical protein